jgi:hypothetical protein
VTSADKTFVISERSEFERLQALVRTVQDGDLPKLFEEVLVGKLPLRLDILLIRREAGELSEASHQDLAVLLPLLNRFTLMQFKGPTDALQRGDLAQLVGCAFLWHSQQAEPIPQRDISLIVLAPTVNAAVRDELE